jgi:hypothetical protein
MPRTWPPERPDVNGLACSKSLREPVWWPAAWRLNLPQTPHSSPLTSTKRCWTMSRWLARFAVLSCVKRMPWHCPSRMERLSWWFASSAPCFPRTGSRPMPRPGGCFARAALLFSMPGTALRTMNSLTLSPVPCKVRLPVTRLVFWPAYLMVTTIRHSLFRIWHWRISPASPASTPWLNAVGLPQRASSQWPIAMARHCAMRWSSAMPPGCRK